jgi:hypothetical protein
VNGLEELMQSMRTSGNVGAPIDVVRMHDGGLITLDNARVLAAFQSGMDVQAVVHEATESFSPQQIERFTTSAAVPRTWGDAVRLRIQNQGVAFANRYPNGSPYTGVK